jgi:hypothetical protein
VFVLTAPPFVALAPGAESSGLSTDSSSVSETSIVFVVVFVVVDSQAGRLAIVSKNKKG